MVVTVPPCLADLPGGRYAVAGSTWIRVPDDTKFEDLDKYMTYEAKRPESPSDASAQLITNPTDNDYWVTWMIIHHHP